MLFFQSYTTSTFYMLHITEQLTCYITYYMAWSISYYFPYHCILCYFALHYIALLCITIHYIILYHAKFTTYHITSYFVKYNYIRYQLEYILCVKPAWNRHAPTRVQRTQTWGMVRMVLGRHFVFEYLDPYGNVPPFRLHRVENTHYTELSGGVRWTCNTENDGCTRYPLSTPTTILN